MQHFQQIEYGLPSKDFVQASVDRGRASAGMAAEGRRTLRFRPGSPWQGNREAGQRLSWRGRNFIEAFAAINHADLVRATMLDLPANLHPVSLRLDPIDERTLPGERGACFHFVCRASSGSRMQAGDDIVSLHDGDLWRVYRGDLPAIVHGGCGGGTHLIFVLAPQPVAARPGIISGARKFGDGQNKSSAAA